MNSRVRIHCYFLTYEVSWVVVHTLLSELGRQQQADNCEFEISLVYIVSSRTAMATQSQNKMLFKNIIFFVRKKDGGEKWREVEREREDEKNTSENHQSQRFKTTAAEK